jgi:hypothetical protein
VMENSWDGWTASSGPTPLELLPDHWLSIKTATGERSFSFRYRPWDVWVGLLLTLTGIGICIYLWIKTGRKSDHGLLTHYLFQFALALNETEVEELEEVTPSNQNV